MVNLGLTMLMLYLPNLDKGPIRWWSFDINIPNVFSSMVVGSFLVGSATVFLASGTIKAAAKDGTIPTIDYELLLEQKYTGRLMAIKRVNLRSVVFGMACTMFTAIPIITVGAIACAATSSWVKLDDGDSCTIGIKPFTALFVCWSTSVLAVVITLNYLSCLNSAGFIERPLPTVPKKKRCGCKSHNCCYIFGVLFLFFGLGIPIIVSQAELQLLSAQAIMTSTNPNFPDWKDPSTSPMSPKMDWSLYNISNPDGIFRGEKPVMEEVGPLVFDYHESKFNVAFDEESGAVQYNSWFYFTYDPENNKALPKHINEHTLVTVVNPSLLGIIAEIEGILPAPVGRGAIWRNLQHNKETKRAREGAGTVEHRRLAVGGGADPTPESQLCELIVHNATEKKICEILFKALDIEGEGIKPTAEGNADTAYFVTRPIKEIIFGYKNSQVMSLVKKLIDEVFPKMACSTDFPGLQFNSSDLAAAEALGLNRARTGKLDIAKAGAYIWYRGSGIIMPPDLGTPLPNPATPPWGTTIANTIEGCSAGGMFPGGNTVVPDKPLQIFAMLLYRNVRLLVEPELVEYKGAKLRRAGFHPDTWAMTKENQAAYHQTVIGVMNMSSIMYGVPMYITRRNYMGVGKDNGEAYRNAITVDGGPMKLLEKGSFESYFDIHPIMGVPLRNHDRLLISMGIGPIEFSVGGKNVVMDGTAGIRKLTLPLAWSDVRASMSDAKMNELNTATKAVKDVRTGARALFFPLFALCLAMGARMSWIDEQREDLEFAHGISGGSRGGAYATPSQQGEYDSDVYDSDSDYPPDVPDTTVNFSDDESEPSLTKGSRGPRILARVPTNQEKL
jgi:hypothetical protein